ncbi:hypothetical protein REB14_15760 [Chryseobacterium sp. ES2]|uniref:Uncharacterized protein n=1 Tax=Chryseobacterium metallicongregator TaxID=3073042 RepID=A0ABU1E7Q6_9FLAO|nr:hypothetical protein [Chryseobacterium sp. ES2]MDR4953635.1 hypothetical protein [Chryseobacterium sp. ES2]
MISKKVIIIGLLSVNTGLFAQAGNVGINTTTPGTTLDVNGAITNRETAVAVASNAVTVPANVSQVQLTGAATATVTITAPAAPNAGQRLVIFNNTTGGFGATLNGVTIPNGKALEFVYSNSGWRSTDGGAVGTASVNIYNTNGSLTSNRTVSQGANTLAFTGNQVNAFSVDGNTLSVDAANHRIGIGTSTPDTPLTVQTPDNNFGFSHTNGTISLKSYIGGGKAYFGTTTPNDLYLVTNNTNQATITSAGNFGIRTSTPQKTLHVNGSLQVTNELNVGGDASTPGSSGIAGQVLKSNGPGAAPTWQNLAGVPSSTGTVIAVNGQFLVAQEIIVQLTSDFTVIAGSNGGVPVAIGSLNNEIVDNENLYTGSPSTNLFKVSADGVYQIIMNGQLITTDNPPDTNGVITATAPVLGIWDDTNGNWVARVNDVYSSKVTFDGVRLQTYTLITSIPMLASHTYSFRLYNTRDVTIKYLSSGATGSGPVTQMSLKRLK